MQLRTWIVFFLVLLIFIGVIMVTFAVSGPPAPTPVGMISTTLNQDGISGRNFFQAVWSLDNKTPEEIASLRELAEDIKYELESEVINSVRVWEEEYNSLLILETTVDFYDPSEVKGTLAIVYGRGYSRSDISIEIHEPKVTQLKTTWFIDITVNPGKVSCVDNFEWKVNMPGKIAYVEVTPHYANVHYSRLGSNTVEIIFEPEDMFITVSVQAEESRVGGTIVWPIVVGIVGTIAFVILAYIVRRTFRRVRARRQHDEANNRT